MFAQRLILAIALCALSGCAMLAPSGHTRQGRSATIVEFLYPNGEVPSEESVALPRLNLPLRVGIAFLPDRGFSGLTEMDKNLAMERVRGVFSAREFVADITVVPSHYVRNDGGVPGVAQMGRLLGLDAVALVSYNQVTTERSRDSALLYLTIVGEFVVKGTEQSVQTMVDTAVIDVDSARLIVRAPGFSRQRQNVTYSDSRREMARSAGDDLQRAIDAMSLNLGVELDQMAERIRDGRESRFDVQWREGSSRGGGGASGLAMLGLAAALWRRRRTQRF